MTHTPRRVLAVLAALTLAAGIGTATASSADAARAPVTTITVQWDADVPQAWPRNAPDLWEHGTRLRFVTGTCDGPMCIQIHGWESTQCNTYAIGCAEVGVLKTETCDVWLNPIATDPTYGLSRRVFAAFVLHETGHCLGLGHVALATDKRSVMLANIDPTRPNSRPSAQDIRNANALWP
jgi:hypothetical protein